MANVRPAWPDALDPTFRTIFDQQEKGFTQVGPTIFRQETSQKNIEKDSSASGLSKMVQMSEGSALTYEDKTQGYDVTYTHLKFGLGGSVTQEMWEDDQFSVMKRIPSDLARAKMRTKEQFAADIFNYGFTSGGGGSALFTGGDAVALFSSAHTRTDGGANQSNYTTQDLAEDSLETALVAIDATLDDKGQLMGLEADTLVIPPALEKEARILLNSTGRVGTANNDINPYEGRLKIVVWKYLGSTGSSGSDTGWFLLDSSQHRLNWFNRSDRGLEGPFYDFDTKTAKWSSIARWSAGWSDWRGVYGSKGDNS